MSRRVVPRLVATGAVVTTSTVFRVGAGCIRLWTRRTPQLLQLAAGTLVDGDHARSASALREEVVGLLRDSAEVSWFELRRGVDDFDAFTRTDDEAVAPSRPFRVKP